MPESQAEDPKVVLDEWLGRLDAPERGSVETSTSTRLPGASSPASASAPATAICTARCPVGSPPPLDALPSAPAVT